MDIMVCLLKTRIQHDFIWVILERMTKKSANFIPVNSTFRTKDYARLFKDNIVRWHGIPLSII